MGLEDVPEFLRRESGEKHYGDKTQRVQNLGNLKGALGLKAGKRLRRKPGSCPESTRCSHQSEEAETGPYMSKGILLGFCF